MSKIRFARLASNLATRSILSAENIANPTHVSFTPSPGYDPEMRGKAYMRITNDNGKKELLEIPPSSYQDLDLLALGGLDFDSSFHMSALLKSVETLLPAQSALKYGAIYPNATRKERFEAATTYNKDKLYYSPYIESLTRDYILPRFVNDKTSDLQEPKKSLTLFSFSVGGREIMMMENCFRKILLEDYNLSKPDVHSLFTYIKGISVAYAADYVDLPELRFPKTTIISGKDIGVLQPEQLTRDMTWNPLLDQSKIHLFTSKDTDKYSHPSQIFYLGNKTVPLIVDKNKLATKGHSLPHYVAAIKNSELHTTIARLMDNKTNPVLETQVSIAIENQQKESNFTKIAKITDQKSTSQASTQEKVALLIKALQQNGLTSNTVPKGSLKTKQQGLSR